MPPIKLSRVMFTPLDEDGNELPEVELQLSAADLQRINAKLHRQDDEALGQKALIKMINQGASGVDPQHDV